MMGNANAPDYEEEEVLDELKLKDTDGDDDYLKDFLTPTGDEKLNGSLLSILIEKTKDSEKFALEKTEIRNILIVGKTRSGKSTLVKMLKDPYYIPKNYSIFSKTRDAKFYTFTISKVDNEKQYTFNFVDTPGLKEFKENPEESRSDDIIIDAITQCLKNEIVYMNSIILCASFESGLDPRDIESFGTFMRLFASESMVFTVCVTRTERRDVKWRNDLIREFAKIDFFEKLMRQKKIKFFFTGCLTRELLGFGEESAIKTFGIISKDREKILDHIFSKEAKYKLNELPITVEILNSFDRVTDVIFENITRWYREEDSVRKKNCKDIVEQNILYIEKNSQIFQQSIRKLIDFQMRFDDVVQSLEESEFKDYLRGALA